MVLVSKSCIFSGLCLAATVQGDLVQVTDFGSNPAGLEMYIDLPENLTTNAPVILAVSCLSLPAARSFLLTLMPFLASWMWRVCTEILRAE